MAKTEKTAAELYREERKARLAKSAKKNAKKSISSNASKVAGRVITAVLVIALVAGLSAVVVNQSGILPRSKTAFTVGEEKVTEAEYAYYYLSVYNMYSQYAAYGYDIGLDTTKAPSQQEYNDTMGEIENFPEDQTPTWADFLNDQTKLRLQYVKAAKAECEKSGIELTDADYKTIDDQIAEYDEYAASASGEDSRYSLSAYLKASFGKGMNEKVFKKIVTDQQYATKLQEVKTDDFKKDITEKEINKEFEDNKLSYTKAGLYSYTFDIAAAGEDVKDKDAFVKTEMAKAKAKAEAFAAKATPENFKQLAADAEKADGNKNYEEYLTIDSRTYGEYDYENTAYSNDDEKFIEWAFGENTAKGSTFTVEVEGSGYTVYVMGSPLHKAADYATYDSRHILVMFEKDAEKSAEETENASEEKTEEKTEEKKEEIKVETLDVSSYKDVNVDFVVDAETAKNKASYKKAQDILKEYLDGDHTAEAFGALAEKYSEDTGSNTAGGLYEGTAEGEFVPPYEEWCLAEGRKEGDVAIVEYDGSNYQGYHIIYFEKRSNVTWMDTVKGNLASTKVNEYVEKLVDADSAAIANENEKSIAAAEDTLKKMLKSSSSSEQHYEGDGHDHG